MGPTAADDAREYRRDGGVAPSPSVPLGLPQNYGYGHTSDLLRLDGTPILRDLPEPGPTSQSREMPGPPGVREFPRSPPQTSRRAPKVGGGPS